MSAYSAKAAPKFNSQFKKFYPKEQETIKHEIKKILEDPAAGELKKGPLAEIRVHKFKIHHQLHLLAYETDVNTKTVYLYALATHENFYKALERYLR
ncbi:MAG: type II toxin-antitoxin system RelE/ParE family toxin [Elusimicrobia bacterium]|nr:type II toxin-antitoxin system RelE/ParE family toxin [Elusimicrobiota bacterium]